MIQYTLLLVLSVLLFLYGFFPISNTPTRFTNEPPTLIDNFPVNITEIYPAHYKKLVLIIIDALRWDFVSPEWMPHTVNHLNTRGCLNKVLVESPTVTLPRIKALTTGSVPQYIDVVRNLASSEILQDSWLHSAKKKGLKTVFYGDNTWEKLFPKFFERSDGTTSFFVWDFTEVDNNVTRNVDLELERSDWDIMILHYLGLDHIGHVLGPFSSRMPLKLKEMDEIINKIYNKVSKNDKTLVLVTGDHGMRDSGGHGGTTNPEVMVPLIALGLECQYASFLQTDIPANIAALFGLNIPSTSIGNIQKSFLTSLSLKQYLYILRYNTQLLLKKHENFYEDFRNATEFHIKFLQSNKSYLANVAAELYTKCSDEITKDLYEKSSKQDMPDIFVAILVMANLLMVLVSQLLSSNIKCYHLYVLCFKSMVLQFFFKAQYIFISSMVILCVLLLLQLKNTIKQIVIMPFPSALNSFIILTFILHPFTFISTSFIEEEHYFWIFFSVTFVLLIMIFSCNEKAKKTRAQDHLNSVLVNIFLRFSMDLNSTVENSVQNTDNWAQLFNLEKNSVYSQMFFGASLFLVLITLQRSCSKDKNSTYLASMFNIPILIFIFVLKNTTYHNALLGKLIWALIFIEKLCLRLVSWQTLWILAVTLLIKPHNVILIPFAVYTASQIYNLKKLSVPAIAGLSYMLSNCFYFLQGHRNTLASVDVSVGYIGLKDYYPVLVISQVLIHTYAFPVLFHIIALKCIINEKEKKQYWLTLLTLRSSVVLFTCIVMVIFRHHLFIWSVFAPKFFIECVHTGFLFIEMCCWYLYSYLSYFQKFFGKR